MAPACLLAALLLAGAPIPAKSAVVSGLQSWLDGTSTLDMQFRQTLVSGALGTTASERGRMYLERPGKLRWDYLDPEKKIALLLGDRTVLYLEDDRQLTRGRLTAEQGLFPRLLAGRERLDDLFNSTLVATPAAGGDGAFRLRLTPKGDPAAMSVVILTLRASSFAIESAELVDETGNRTTYAFSEVRRNRGVPAGIFAFEPPAGTEIVGEP
jgi:outer membrane lipoprotein carrier protein